MKISSAFLSVIWALALHYEANAQTTPLDYEYYVKFPNHGNSLTAAPITPPGIHPHTYAGLQKFHDLLTRMRKAQAELRADCIGQGSVKMTTSVRGAQVLVWPERFQQCEANYILLAQGDRLFNIPLADWNKTYGAQYELPKGDTKDLQAWQRRRAEILRFPQPGCDDASRYLTSPRTQGSSETPVQLYARMKNVCPARWGELFAPEEEIKDKEAAASRKCRPGTTYFVSDEKSNGAVETCDESDKYIPSTDTVISIEKREGAISGNGNTNPSCRSGITRSVSEGENSGAVETCAGADTDPAGSKLSNATGENGPPAKAEEGSRQVADRNSAEDIETELNAIGNGQYAQLRSDSSRPSNLALLHDRKRTGGGLTEAMQRQVSSAAARTERSGASGMSEQHSQLASSAGESSCDDAAEQRASIAMQEAATARTSSLPQSRQNCAHAKDLSNIYVRGLSYAQRCRPESVQAVRAELQRSRDVERDMCDGASSTATSSPNFSAPTRRVPAQSPRPSPVTPVTGGRQIGDLK